MFPINNNEIIMAIQETLDKGIVILFNIENFM